MRTRTLIAAAVCLALSACAAVPVAPPTPAADGELRVLNHACDEFGVVALTIAATGAVVGTLHWSNKGVCGTPT